MQCNPSSPPPFITSLGLPTVRGGLPHYISMAGGWTRHSVSRPIRISFFLFFWSPFSHPDPRPNCLCAVLRIKSHHFNQQMSAARKNSAGRTLPRSLQHRPLTRSPTLPQLSVHKCRVRSATKERKKKCAHLISCMRVICCLEMEKVSVRLLILTFVCRCLFRQGATCLLFFVIPTVLPACHSIPARATDKKTPFSFCLFNLHSVFFLLDWDLFYKRKIMQESMFGNKSKNKCKKCKYVYGTSLSGHVENII